MSSITFSQASGFITLQDQGRIGFANIAVPTSGAFDQSAHHLGNRLVGNFPGACSIESLRGTFKFLADTDLVIAVTGAAARTDVCEQLGYYRLAQQVAVRLSARRERVILAERD